MSIDMKRISRFTVITIFSLLAWMPLSHVLAAKSLKDSEGLANKVSQKAGLFDRSITGTVASAISGALSLIAIFFFILMVYGGFLWMTARGNDDQVEKAKNLIKDAIIGMVIVVMAYGITVVVGQII